MLRLVISTGGSVGHLAPAVAVWRALQKLEGDATVHVLCSDRPADAAYLKFENLPYTPLPLPRRSATLPFTASKGFFRARALMRELNPTVFFSKGGAVSVAPALAARAAGIPVVLHESDVVSGYANRMVASFANRVCLGFPQDRQHANAVLTGNPVREQITQGSMEEGLRITGFDGKRPVVLVMGGSQGAVAVNDAIHTLLHQLLDLADVVHLTGEGKSGSRAQHGYKAMPFVTSELPHLYALADIAVSRAGAGSIAELAANGIPTILVPIRGLAQDHQYKNALYAREHGGCAIVEQKDLRRELLPVVRDWLGNPAVLEEKSRLMREIADPDAAQTIAKEILSLSKTAVAQ